MSPTAELQRAYVTAVRRQSASPMRTGVSDEIERRKRKEYQFANKPTQDNPFVAPVKYTNATHQKRLLENYKMTTVQDSEEFTVQLTPCRWDRTGWKYRQPEERQRYFNHPNKNNFHGHSNQRMYTPSKTNRTLKKQFRSVYQRTMKDRFKEGLYMQPKIVHRYPEEPNDISNMYPSLPLASKTLYQSRKQQHLNSSMSPTPTPPPGRFTAEKDKEKEKERPKEKVLLRRNN